MDWDRDDTMKQNNSAAARDMTGYQKEDTLNLNLYDDIPKDVVELLMKTHPLLDEKKADLELSRYETRSRRNEVEAVKRERRAAAAREREAVRSNPDEAMPNPNYGAEAGAVAEDDVEEDIIQLVKHRPEPKRGLFAQDSEKKVKTAAEAKAARIREDMAQKSKPMVKVKPERSYQDDPVGVSMQEQEPSRLQRTEREPSAEEEDRRMAKGSARQAGEYSGRRRRNEEDVDLAKLEKEKTLDAFFNNSLMDEDDFEDEPEGIALPGGRKTLIIGVSVLVLLFGFLTFKTVSLSGKAEEAKLAQTQAEALKTENESLKLENNQLAEQVKILKNGGVLPEENNGEQEKPADSGKAEENTPAASGNVEEYTVVENDSYWKIAQKVYGDGSQYKKILEANNLTESAPVKVGQKLKIPK